MAQNAAAKGQRFGAMKSFNFFVYGTIAIYSTFFPIYLQSIGVSKLEIGMLLAGGPFIAVLSNSFWGYWSDRWNNIRRVLIILLIGNGIVMQTVFFVHSQANLLGLMLAFFFFQSPLFSQSNSYILDAVEPAGRRFGEFRLWGSLGWAIMAVSAGPVLAGLGIGKLWVVYGSMMLVSIALACNLPRADRRQQEAGRRGNYLTIFRNKRFIAFLIIGVLISIPNGMNNTFVSIYISDLGGKEGLIGLSAFLTSIFEIPVFLLFDRLLPRNQRTMIACLIVVSLLYALRWSLMSLATGPYEIIAIQILHCVTFGGYYYIGTQLTSSLIPWRYKASGQALYALSWGGLSGIVAGVAGGWAFQHLGAAATYRIGAAFALLGGAGFAAMLIWMVRVKEASGVTREI
ncbi:MFS transporter [Paenibacillus filicis]|uniref:MFS transporter n=1 Tax=Paenibacillus gyeongsangnamensis TaxID=3388067 RepID=A0ABT4QE89_9BACL|nr:MFS transporter [Paenibacillus filicis]MCZ8515187.1 MFS transporter [Paenibacillus filicis]